MGTGVSNMVNPLTILLIVNCINQALFDEEFGKNSTFHKKVLKLYRAMIYVNKNKVSLNVSEKCDVISLGPNLTAKLSAILPAVLCPMREARQKR
jgi:hypothetical protein